MHWYKEGYDVDESDVCPQTKERNFMTILDSIITTAPRAPRITLYGRPGIGKSTLASSFPDPLFLLTEDPALDNIRALPVANSFEQIWDSITQLNKLEEKPFKTLVLDSVSQLDALIVKYIIAEERQNNPKANKKNLPFGACCGGYGKAYERAQSLHRAFKHHCDKLIKDGIAVVFVCHLTAKKERTPDSEDYDVYSIVMNHDRSREVYIDDVDAVLFGKLRSFTSTTDSGRTLIKSTEERILVTGVNDVHVSKNRYNMPPEIPFSFEEIKKYIPFYNQEQKA